MGRDFTQPGDKFKRARAYIEANIDMVVGLRHWRHWSYSTMYAFLAAHGVRWSVSEKMWYKSTSKVPNTRREIKNDGFGTLTDHKVMIRIIAHQDDMPRRISELTELCEALNWHIQRISSAYDANPGKYQRRYLTITVGDRSD